MFQKNRANDFFITNTKPNGHICLLILYNHLSGNGLRRSLLFLVQNHILAPNLTEYVGNPLYSMVEDSNF